MKSNNEILNQSNNKLSVIKCGECGYSVPKAEALEFEHCAECEACLDIPDEWFNELD